MLYLQLYWEFFKTGLFAVGGGLATLPFLSSIGARTGWFTQSQLADMLAVSESTPGPIGINCATYVGFTAGGVPGAVIATLGLITPSILIILLIAALLKSFQNNRFIVSVFRCLRPASVALIVAAGIAVAELALFLPKKWGPVPVPDWRALVIAVPVFVCSCLVKKTKKLHPILWIGLSAAAGLLLF